MLKKMRFFIGLAAFSLIVGFNVRHAVNGYGVKDNKLHIEVLAQGTTGTGTGTGSGTGTGTTSHGGSNTGWDIITQGLTKDETPRPGVPCSVSIGVPPFVVTNYGTRTVCDDGGTVNCSVSSCKI